MDNIELIKENIAQTTTGRKPALLTALSVRDHDRRQSDLVHAKLAFDQKIADPSLASEHLSIYYQHALWLLSHFPEGPDREKHLLPVLEQATRTFFNSSQHRLDPQYLKLWLLYVVCSEEKNRNEIYRHMHSSGVGNKAEVFYAEWAKYLEHQCKNIIEARDVFLMGIAAVAQPIEKLRKRYSEFMQRNESEIETLLSKRSLVKLPSSSGSISHNSKSFTVFVDENDENNVEPTVQSKNPFSTECRREAENSIVPTADWKSQKILTSVATKATQKVAVLQDFASCTLSTNRSQPKYAVDLFVKGCSFISFEQWRIHQILLKTPLSQMKRLEPILPPVQKRQQSSNKRPLDATPIRKNHRALTVPSCTKPFASSPTVNTKAAVNEISSMFCENLYESTSEESFTEMDDSFSTILNERNGKFQIFNEQLPVNPFPSHLADITEELTNPISVQTPKTSTGENILSPSPITKLSQTMENAAVALSTPTIDRPVADFSRFSLVTVLCTSFYSDCLRRINLNHSFIDLKCQTLPDLKKNKSLRISDQLSFEIEREAETLNENSAFVAVKLNENSYPVATVLLIIGSERLDWEFHVLSRINDSDAMCKDLYCINFSYIKFSLGNVLAVEYPKCGTLLDCINLYLERDEVFDEIVVLYILSELLKAVNELHRVGIIHCDLKCESIFVNNDFNKPPIQITNFASAIDCKLFDLANKIRFTATLDPDLEEESCVAIQTKTPFSYEIDYFGIASVAYALLFMDFISIVKNDKFDSQTAKWVIKKSFKKQKHPLLWARLFDFLINTSCVSGEPMSKEISFFIDEIDSILRQSPDRELSINRHYWTLLSKP